MRSFIEQIEFNAQNIPKNAILFDEVIAKGITCEGLDRISGQVYAYLKQKGIGRILCSSI